MEKKCVVWGTREAGRRLAHQAEKVGYSVVAYCSSTKDSQGKQINGRPVVSPEEAKRSCLEGESDYILLGVKNTSYRREIEEIIRRDFSPNIHVIDSDTIENEYLVYVPDHLRYQWNVEFTDQAEIWLENFMSEVDFWVKEVAAPKGPRHQAYRDKLRNTDFLGIDRTCSRLADGLNSHSVVMDIGCGLYSMYGNRLPNAETLQMIAVDPLAPFYNRINEKCAGVEFERTKFGMFEFAANFFEENFCDVILINNALDHCIDPYKSIIECLYILKVGGKIRLRHRRAEAVNTAYGGLHKWNIDYDGQDRFILWNDKNAVNVSTNLREVADITLVHGEETCSRENQMITIEVVKKRSFPLEDFFNMEDERHQLAFLVEGLMNWISRHEDGYLGYLESQLT